VAQQRLSYLGRAAGAVGVIRLRAGELFPLASFDFSAKFCIIGVPYHEIRPRKYSGDR
jgi:hypothetical protein